MFKLACFTDEISQDLARALEVCNEHGLDGVELRSAWEKGPHNFSAEQRDDVKRLIGDSGLSVASIASPFFKCDLGDKAARQEHLGILRTCIELGRELGANIIRGFTFWRTTDPDEALMRRIAAEFDDVVSILDGEGAILGIENEAACHVGSARELRLLLDLVGSDRVKAIWDPSNQVYMPDEVELPFPVGYELIREDIVHVHIKDSVRLADGERTHVPVGEGDANWAEQFAALKKDGYAGYCSLETHWRPSAEMAEDVMKRPGGSAYTEGAEAGSRICLANIGRLVAAL